jgi:hypothetical protein
MSILDNLAFCLPTRQKLKHEKHIAQAWINGPGGCPEPGEEL